MASHTWRRVFTDTNNLRLSIYWLLFSEIDNLRTVNHNELQLMSIGCHVIVMLHEDGCLQTWKETSHRNSVFADTSNLWLTVYFTPAVPALSDGTAEIKTGPTLYSRRRNSYWFIDNSEHLTCVVFRGSSYSVLG